MDKYLHKLLFVTEAGRGAVDLARLYLDRDLFRHYSIGSNEPVLVIPGYHCSDEYTKMFREFLTRLGFTVYGWGQGTNLAKVFQYNKLCKYIYKLYIEHNQKPIRVIGYSLGGLYARKLATDHPEIIHSVITMGTPIYQDVEISSMRYISMFAKLSGADYRIQEFLKCIDIEPLVPVLVLYSKTDGIVHWRDALDKKSTPKINHVCIKGSHMGMMHNPMTWRIVRQQYQFS